MCRYSTNRLALDSVSIQFKIRETWVCSRGRGSRVYRTRQSSNKFKIRRWTCLTWLTTQTSLNLRAPSKINQLPRLLRILWFLRERKRPLKEISKASTSSSRDSTKRQMQIVKQRSSLIKILVKNKTRKLQISVTLNNTLIGSAISLWQKRGKRRNRR